MSIKYAILGFLSWDSLSGYDLKKLFEETPAFHWSGNNNQIYKALVELHEQGLVELRVEQQADYPPRKLYSITTKGRAELRGWVLATPELPQVRNSFLVQLAWADQLEPAELDGLLAAYEEEMSVQLLMFREHKQRRIVSPDRTPREARLWDAIMDNRISSYENELNWVRKLRGELAETHTGEHSQ
jgi:PadR family transcriptional regulator AphA